MMTPDTIKALERERGRYKTCVKMHLLLQHHKPAMYLHLHQLRHTVVLKRTADLPFFLSFSFSVTGEVGGKKPRGITENSH